ncbi:Bifunctional cytochrome P450/NADPH--P450 reductase [Paramyrothecium foliicola]|nr:Bifunctional cytochrome P450/NADPH--P450 reductase [Paramyrothecium foliicola]
MAFAGANDFGIRRVQNWGGLGFILVFGLPITRYRPQGSRISLGHEDWRASLLKIPTAIDEVLAQHGHGGNRLIPLFNVHTGSEDEFMWLESNAKTLRVFLQDPPTGRRGFTKSLVTNVILLTVPLAAQKVQVGIEVSEGWDYSVGESLQVMPLNPKASIQRALSRFHLAWYTYLKLESDKSTDLPTEYPISVADLVETGRIATPGNIRVLVEATNYETTQKALATLRYPSNSLSIEAFLSMLPLPRPRIYSIASDPQWNPGQGTIVASVINGSHWSGFGGYLGVATNYLAGSIPGGLIKVALKQTSPIMQLAAAPLDYPIIMIAAGSGITSFRSFIRKRALQARAGKRLKNAVLFFWA